MKRIWKPDPWVVMSLSAAAFAATYALTGPVIAASALGLPVSSTHITVGALFGVGFCRELRTNAKRAKALARQDTLPIKRRVLVRRRHLVTIVTAWMVTVPVSALLAGTVLLVMTDFLGGQ